jgi:hypothetical protein
MKLLKALMILGMVLLQWGVVVLNLNRYGPFQSFVDIEWYEEHPKQEAIPATSKVNLFI